jgi:hypothetical protein
MPEVGRAGKLHIDSRSRGARGGIAETEFPIRFHFRDEHRSARRPVRTFTPENVRTETSQETTQAEVVPTLRVMDLLRSYAPSVLSRRNVARQVINVLSRILLCRTAMLKGHVYECPNCLSRRNVYNSCVDRHCPQCGGARRAGWLDKTSELVLPKVNYFQVIFTLPDRLSSLILGNRLRAASPVLFKTLTDVTM